MSEKLLLTVPEAAERLGVCRAFAYQLVTKGAIKSVKLGKARRVPVAELESYIRQLLESQDQEAYAYGG